MQVTYEADQTLPHHDALVEMDCEIKSVSLTAVFPDGAQLDPADIGSACATEEAFVEWLRYAIDSLHDHEPHCAEHERIEELIREIVDGDDVEVEVEITVELRDGRHTQ
jgi:hypothetical protein